MAGAIADFDHDRQVKEEEEDGEKKEDRHVGRKNEELGDSTKSIRAGLRKRGEECRERNDENERENKGDPKRTRDG